MSYPVQFPPGLTALQVDAAINDYLDRIGREGDAYDNDDPWQDRSRAYSVLAMLAFCDEDDWADPFITDRDQRQLVVENLPQTPPQPREHQVPCRACYRLTWNVSGFCDRHPAIVDDQPTAYLSRVELKAREPGS